MEIYVLGATLSLIFWVAFITALITIEGNDAWDSIVNDLGTFLWFTIVIVALSWLSILATVTVGISYIATNYYKQRKGK